MSADDKQRCASDLLLFVAISSEKTALKSAARELNVLCKGKHLDGVGSVKTMGSIGSNRVNVFETDMGPFGYRGSAATAMYVTGATGIIQLGMAFGSCSRLRKIGEVPSRTPPHVADHADPNNPTARVEAKELLLSLFANAADDLGGCFHVHVATLLSGGACIKSEGPDYLLRSVTSGDQPFVGGEMEGVGLPPACLRASS